MRRLVLFSLVLFWSLPGLTQSPKNSEAFFNYLQDTANILGQITICQDSSVKALIEKHIRINRTFNNTIDGYRIQIFSGSGVEARDKIGFIRSEFISTFPDFNVKLIYPLYQPPFFKVRVGDFRNKNEALPAYKQIVKKFPNAYIVKEKINYPKLD